MPETTTIEGAEYTLVGVQRGGLAVYRGDGGYLRIGDGGSVARDVASHREMEQAGYTVAQILSEGATIGGNYYIEASQGDISFRNLFSTEIQKDGRITDATFNRFLNIVEQYLRRQIATKRVNDASVFKRRIKLDVLFAEMPQYADTLETRFGQAMEALSDMPYVLSHGDFNPANLYERGVIDLEDALAAPFGYDAVTALATVDWVPPHGDYEYTRSYTYTPEQNAKYLELVDRIAIENGLQKVSTLYPALEFCRAVWMISDLQKWPKAQAYEHEHFMRKYLSESFSF